MAGGLFLLPGAGVGFAAVEEAVALLLLVFGVDVLVFLAGGADALAGGLDGPPAGGGWGLAEVGFLLVEVVLVSAEVFFAGAALGVVVGLGGVSLPVILPVIDKQRDGNIGS